MKFIDYLASIGGISVYPLISLVIFFLFFIVLFVYMFRADKKHIEYMAQLPVEADDQDQNTEQNL